MTVLASKDGITVSGSHFDLDHWEQTGWRTTIGIRAWDKKSLDERVSDAVELELESLPIYGF